MTRRLEDSLRDQKKQTEQYNQPIYGILGAPIGGTRKVEVPNRNSYVYVRLRDSLSEIIQAFNNRVSPAYNLPVVLERQGNRYVVLDVDSTRYDNNHSSFSPYLPRHGNTHSFDIESGGGGDIVWVYPRQFMPLLAFPSGSVGSPNVIVSPYTLRKDNGTWQYVGNTGTSNFTPYNPPNSGTAVMGLIALDTVSGNPFLLIGSGTTFSDTLTGSSQVYPYIPALTNPAHIPIAAVRLVSGTSRITWDNIYDVRQFVHPIQTGSGGGISSVAVQDEGAPLGSVTTFNFTGDGVTATISGSVARVHIPAGSGSSSFSGDPDRVVLTDSLGALYTQPWFKWGSSRYIELGADVTGKEANAGKIGYDTFGAGYLYIVGSATGSASRNVKIFDDLYVNSNLFINGEQQILASKQVSNGDSHDHLGGDGAQINHTSLASIGTNTHAQIDTFIAGNQSTNDLRYGRIDGWQIHTGTWARQSADAPNYVASVSPYSAGVIFVGMKVDLFQDATDKYFFVQKIETTGSVGYLTLYGGTDYALTANSISSSKYSFDKIPAGFPIDPDKWTVSFVSTGSASVSSPTADLWHTPGSLSFSAPLGLWKVYSAMSFAVIHNVASVSNLGGRCSISSTSGSASHPELTREFLATMPISATATLRSTAQVQGELISLSSKTIMYLIALSSQSVTSLTFRGDLGGLATKVDLVCAYL